MNAHTDMPTVYSHRPLEAHSGHVLATKWGRASLALLNGEIGPSEASGFYRLTVSDGKSAVHGILNVVDGVRELHGAWWIQADEHEQMFFHGHIDDADHDLMNQGTLDDALARATQILAHAVSLPAQPTNIHTPEAPTSAGRAMSDDDIQREYGDGFEDLASEEMSSTRDAAISTRWRGRLLSRGSRHNR